MALAALVGLHAGHNFPGQSGCNWQGGSTVILEEGVGQTRWNISNPLDVTLVVEEACCRPIPRPDPPCEGDECLIVDQVCHFEVDNIGGNLFRTVGWNVDGSGNLVNPRVLPVCGSQNHNEFVLTFDNRIPPPDPAHPASHPCGPGTVHTCTTEPDTHITAVRINGVAVDPCDTVDATTGTLEIDFLAHDPDGHLAFYLL